MSGSGPHGSRKGMADDIEADSLMRDLEALRWKPNHWVAMKTLPLVMERELGWTFSLRLVVNKSSSFAGLPFSFSLMS